MTAIRHRNDPAWEQALDWLLRLRASPDDDALRAAHEAWLAQSAGHRRAYRKAEKVWRLTGEISHTGIKPVRQEPMPHAGRWRRRRAVGLAVAAISACLAFLFLLPDLEVRLQADYATGAGERRLVALADGSTVHLDAGTAISVGSGLARAVRLLAGEAFFEVAPDHGRPFTVTAENVTIRVVGTAFDVQFASKSVAVAVQSGKVEVEVSRNGQLTTGSVGPGDRLTVDRTTGTLAFGAVEAGQVASWRTGRLVLDGATIAQVVEQVRRYSQGAILLTDDRLAERRITGVFDLHDPVAALRAAVEPHAGQVTEVTPYLLLIGSR